MIADETALTHSANGASNAAHHSSFLHAEPEAGVERVAGVGDDEGDRARGALAQRSGACVGPVVRFGDHRQHPLAEAGGHRRAAPDDVRDRRARHTCEPGDVFDRCRAIAVVARCIDPRMLIHDRMQPVDRSIAYVAARCDVCRAVAKRPLCRSVLTTDATSPSAYFRCRQSASRLRTSPDVAVKPRLPKSDVSDLFSHGYSLRRR
jgi:hypothetical protein